MPIHWRKHWVSDESFESAGVWDVDGDGILDIVSGSFWYKGPDFRRKYFIGTTARYDEYYDDFSTIAMDIDGDGRLDIVTGGWWGDNLRWWQCPPDPTQPWQSHILAAHTSNVETTRAWDIDGDGVREIIANTPNHPTVTYYKISPVAPHATAVPVYTFAEGGQGHGLGCGDIAGHGRMDIVLCHGWLEAPANPATDTWQWHPEFSDAPWANMASIPMLVVDVDGDGRNELITGHAHGYGLWWSKRQPDGTWQHHVIDPDNAQYHDLHWADIDGDGVCELVTGKRHRAHNGRDVGEWDALGIYYFKWAGTHFVKQIIDYGVIGVGHGCGIHFALADLRGTGRLDLIAPGKDGLVVYYNEGPFAPPVT